MTLGVLVLRRSFLKVLGGVIQAGLDRGHRLVILWDDGPTKPGDRLSEADLAPWPDAERVRYAPDRVAAQLASLGVNALVSSELYYHISRAELTDAYAAARSSGVRLYSVSYIFDSVWREPEGYALLDRTCYVSEYWRNLHWLSPQFADGFERIGDRNVLEARSAVTGSPMLDHWALVNPIAARARYGLPLDRPVVLFMSLKMNVPDNPWRRLVWGRGPRAWRAAKALAMGQRDLVPEILHGRHYRDLVAAIRRFCDRHGALLVVKYKGKNDDPAFLRRAADLYVDDLHNWPYTSLELMAVARLCVHFESAAVVEAAFAGVPSISIAVSQSHVYENWTGPLDELYGGAPGTLQNFRGVVRRVPAGDAVDVFDTLDLGDVRLEPDARAQFVQKFLGFDDTKSSHRILDVMER